ncbi:TPM domain-containing protein [soil metagenome]
MKAPDLFSDADRERVRVAVSEAELLSSGEIRVYIEDECKGNVLDRAAFVFEELEMHLTELRNGVLIYLAVESKKFAIIGDAGINAHAVNNFWDEVKSGMAGIFSEGRIVDAIVHGVSESGKLLVEKFPRSETDKNELSDDIVFGGE